MLRTPKLTLHGQEDPASDLQDPPEPTKEYLRVFRPLRCWVVVLLTTSHPSLPKATILIKLSQKLKIIQAHPHKGDKQLLYLPNTSYCRQK